MSSSDSALGGAKQEPSQEQRTTNRKKVVIGILAVIVVVCLGVLAFYWRGSSQKQDPNQSSSPSVPQQQPKTSSSDTHADDDARPPAAAFVPGQLLIQFRSTATADQKSSLRQRIGAQLRERISTGQVGIAGFGEGGGGLELLSFESKVTAQADTSGALQEMSRLLKTALSDPSVEFAEPNYIYSAFDTSNDPYYTNGKLWGMYSPSHGSRSQVPGALHKTGDAQVEPLGTTKKAITAQGKPEQRTQKVIQTSRAAVVHPENQYGVRADTAWAAGHIGSRNVYVGIIDAGVQMDHPDLRDNISKAYARNFYEPNSKNPLALAPDDSPHGTHVAGTIGAIGGNKQGVAGVVWKVTMIPVRFIGPDGNGELKNAVVAVQYLTDLKNKGVNIVAINASWGGTAYSNALAQAIKRAVNAGILFIAAAGNAPEGHRGTNNDRYPFYPAGYDTSTNRDGKPKLSFNGVLSVAAINRDGELAVFSNFGRKSVHLAAPGLDIWSTIPTANYGPMSGTSMAAPHVTGAVALFKASHPSSTPREIIVAIKNCVTDTPSIQGKVLWSGRLNVSTF